MDPNGQKIRPTSADKGEKEIKNNKHDMRVIIWRARMVFLQSNLKKMLAPCPVLSIRLHRLNTQVNRDHF